MAEIINLRLARKSKKRTEQAAKADANRLTFGRSKADRTKREAEESLNAKKLDGHKLEE
ncbi:DUF4169 family protein [Govanella unica]|uniref:DUF4169 family protein n=1 Tax=Govanella unica TaxID=2975056 RepID=A0A9X3TYZ0_9PROT|nr:DUF4169 family protein [Govania unica]MDA5194305.1 DUF4169 family protein [Govania unica]